MRARGQLVDPPAREGTWPEVLAAFFRLGLTSFGGPVAHLGYFREEFVNRRLWLDDRSYADVVALCQFLPGPASSQVGIALGFFRAGYLGALAAWIGFTLPSALLMVLLGYGIGRVENVANSGWLHGLKIAAVAVVAQAVLGMARALAPDRTSATLAVFAALIALAMPSFLGQIGAILAGGTLGGGVVGQRDCTGSFGPAAAGEPLGRRCATRGVFRPADRTAAARIDGALPGAQGIRCILSRRFARIRGRACRSAAPASRRGAAGLGE
jgi:chromate transport protein ChrA